MHAGVGKFLIFAWNRPRKRYGEWTTKRRYIKCMHLYLTLPLHVLSGQPRPHHSLNYY